MMNVAVRRSAHVLTELSICSSSCDTQADVNKHGNDGGKEGLSYEAMKSEGPESYKVQIHCKENGRGDDRSGES